MNNLISLEEVSSNYRRTLDRITKNLRESRMKMVNALSLEQYEAISTDCMNVPELTKNKKILELFSIYAECYHRYEIVFCEKKQRSIGNTCIVIVDDSNEKAA